MKNVFLGLAMAGLCACASPKYDFVPKVTQFSLPPIGEASEASIGDPMLSQGVKTEGLGLQVNGEIKTGLYTIRPGVLRRIGTDKQSGVYDLSGLVRKSLLADAPKDVKYDGQGRICVITVFNTTSCEGGVSALVQEVGYSSEGESNFQQTLYYNGRIGDKINIGYREFSGDLARPAFSNDVEYDATVSDEITYKGAQIKIISSDNNSIKYFVLKGFR